MQEHNQQPSPRSAQAVMLASVYLAYKADAVVARQQRRELGLCEACGGLNDPATCLEAGCPDRRPNGRSSSA